MNTRLSKLSEKYDRTAAMGAFPQDYSATPLDTRSRGDLFALANDSSRDLTARDHAIWTLVYNEAPDFRSKELPDFLHSTSTESKENTLRRSASWALFKLGETRLLEESLAKDDDGNTHSWKQHLIYESRGRTDWVDPRPFRVLESKFGFAVTLPLTIHGIVQFRHYDYGRKTSTTARSYGGTSHESASVKASLAPNAGEYDSTKGGADIGVNYGGAGKAALASFNWYSMVAGPVTQRRLVGDLTASVGKNSIYDQLIIQKVCADPLGDGFDHVQGYLFQGMTRSIGGNAMAHYYSSRGQQPLYLSGRIGDASEGVLSVETQLMRTAETNIVTNDYVPYPFVQSVRGLFYGPARMNTIIVTNPNAPIDNLLQIVKEPYANGYFFGEFRSVPVDVDGDGRVELNGMEMYADLQGNVVERTPPGPQPSLAFAR